MRTALVLFSLALALVAGPAQAASVFLEDMTWTEVRDALQAGSTTVLVPIGGTEQNGPHMALGKHNVRAQALAGQVAVALGNALVAPVLAYVPEGRVSPPEGHMRYPGTISVPEPAFKAVLEGAARSFRQHGFVNIVWLGDSGNYQPLLAELAQRLDREWATPAGTPGTAGPTRVLHIAAYYRTAQTTYVQALRSKGLTEAQIGTHAGAADTSLLMAVAPSMVHPDRMASAGRQDGVAGDPRLASAALGQIGVEMIVSNTVAAIRQAVNAPATRRR